MRRTILLLAALAAVPSFAAGQQDGVKRLDGSVISAAQIDATVTQLMTAAEVPGVAVAILNHGEIAHLKAYGLRDKEKNVPLTVDSVMSAASFTKVAFAYMVMQLVDKGILDLDKPVSEYLPKPLPEYTNYKDLADDPRYRRISARMLLSHTSGLPNWRAFEDDRKLKIHFAPGSRFAYSGEGILLLQLEVETITKKSVAELMQEHVFRPLGMTRTSMVWQDRFESDFANGYDEYGRLLGPQKRQAADAAGSMQTTIHDFARFIRAVITGEGLQKSTRDQMLGPQIRILSKTEFPTLSTETTDENKKIRLSYGLGWGVYWTPYGKAFFKEGHDVGWRHYAVGFDREKLGMVVMTNSGNGEGIFKDLLETLLRNTFTPIAWEGYTPYNELPPRPPLKVHKQVPVDARVLEKYVGRYGEPPNPS
ncbi:MAG TPA: serine hydrolase domain-containing protein [Candidatus Angelobacter sp.]|nr:serine hydrolase domain-containing protein [Candidatus Angelobacter sp.]